MHIIARWPGSVHDSTIFNDSPLPVEFGMGRYGNGFLLGDSGYPCNKPHLLTPVLNPINASQEAYNPAHIAKKWSATQIRYHCESDSSLWGVT
jgi:hypothetical protein